MAKRGDFKVAVVRKVAESAAYICSNPYCRRITIGPDQAVSNLSIKTGEAAHICAAATPTTLRLRFHFVGAHAASVSW